MTFENVLASGYLPAAFLTGRFILGKLIATSELRLDLIARFSVSCAIGIACWFPLITVLAWNSAYSPSVVGGAGWICTFALLPNLIAKRSKLNIRSIAVLIFAAVICVWNIRYANESLVGGRDQGLYSNHGQHIAETGSLRAEPMYRKLYEDDHFALATTTQAGGYFFDVKNRNVYFQFSPTFALHLAQGYGIGGYTGLFAVNPLLGSLNALLFFSLLLQFVSYRWSFLAMAFFALNVVQLWNTRITLSEIIAQTFILSGLILASASLRDRSSTGFSLGCLLLLLNAAVRVDGFLVLLGIGVSTALILNLTEEKLYVGIRKTVIHGCLLSIAFTGILLAFDLYSSPGYFKSLSSKVYIMAGCGAIVTALSIIPTSASIRARIRSTLSHRNTLFIILTLLVATFVYGLFIRPSIEPFSIYPEKHPIAGTRDYRENTLTDMGAYLSPVLLLLAFLGAGISLHGVFGSAGRSKGISIILITWALFTLLYLYNPLISPDHIWKMRRFTPIVIPGLILFATIFTAYLYQKIPTNVRWLSFTAVSIACFAHLWQTGQVIAFTKLNDGFANFVSEIRSAIPDNALVITFADSRLLGAIQLGVPYQTIRLNPELKGHFELVKRIAKKEVDAGAELYLLDQFLPLPSNAKKRGKNFQLSTLDFDRKASPFPIELNELNYQASLYAIDQNLLGYKANDTRLEIGAGRILGVGEDGLYQAEFSGDSAYRWTKGKVSFSIPWTFKKKPIAFSMQIDATKPGGSNVSLRVNGKTIFDGLIPENGAEIQLPIDQIDWNAEVIDLSLECETWQPSEQYPGSTDNRILGVRLSRILFQLERDDYIDSGVYFGNKPTDGIAESGLHAVEQNETVYTRWTNGHGSFSFTLDESFTPKYLFLELGSANPNNGRLTVLWNGTNIYTNAALSPPQKIEIEIGDIDDKREITLELLSDYFIPSEQSESTSDNRKLGVMIQSITLEGDSNK